MYINIVNENVSNPMNLPDKEKDSEQKQAAQRHDDQVHGIRAEICQQIFAERDPDTRFSTSGFFR
jgi:hypothetical protein